MRPAVSVLLPVRDAAATLDACLDSIACQTREDHEILAVDDGSRDTTPAILAARAARDPRIRVLRPGRIGLAAALNLGLEAARAPLVARMDGDDLMHPRRLELQLRTLAETPALDLVSCRVRLFPRRGLRAGYRHYEGWLNRSLSPAAVRAQMYVESPLPHPSVVYRRHRILELGGYRDGDFPEDYDLWLRLDTAGAGMAKRPEVLLWWRDGPGRLSRRDPRYRREAFDRLRAAHLAASGRLPAGRPLAYWGAGRPTRRRAAHLIARGHPPAAWIDIDPRKTGNRIQGAPVHPPAWLREARPRPFVLVYVSNHGAREQIAAALAAMGYRPGRDWLGVG